MMKIFSLLSFVFFALILCAAQAIAASTPPLPDGAILTWHNDNFRTGWQQQETILTTSNVSKLGISHSVPLIDQVDAQPLVIPGFLNGHDIAFVADESNNVYQIDATTGAILKQVNFGAPVPMPLGCGTNGPNVGINGTPVIDWNTQTLFVIAYVNGATPTYFLHALDLATLLDRPGSPLTVAASHTLTDGSTATFNATNQRQRAALLFANGNVYAAFASFCDSKGVFSTTNPQPARGWLLGWSWNGTTLAALPANQLDDRQSSSATNQMLDTIWMSGAGPASDEQGNLIFSTGNSDSAFGQAQMPSPGTWTDTVPCSGTATGTPPTNVPCSNIQESVVKINGALTTITGLFSPNAHYGTFSPNTLTMDNKDLDLGSGGVLLAPQRGSSFLAATAGKDGRLFLFDRSSGVGLKLLQPPHQGQGCWCAPSYFAGPDTLTRMVTSQGNQLQTFHIFPSPSLSPVGTATVVASAQDPGFFTTVSCNGPGSFGTCTNMPIIWAVSHPVASCTSSPTACGVNLYAFQALKVLSTDPSYKPLLPPINVNGTTCNCLRVGLWPNIGGNANIVPTVSNGKVYVASNKNLTILAVGGTGALAAAAINAITPTPNPKGFAVSGTLASINGSVLTFKNRHGKERLIDASKAIANDTIEPAMIIGDAYTAVGPSFTSLGALQADAIYRAKCRQHDKAAGDLTGQPACTGDQWPPDRDQGQ